MLVLVKLIALIVDPKSGNLIEVNENDCDAPVIDVPYVKSSPDMNIFVNEELNIEWNLGQIDIEEYEV